MGGFVGPIGLKDPYGVLGVSMGKQWRGGVPIGLYRAGGSLWDPYMGLRRSPYRHCFTAPD